jgi:sugar (pentulose or hexulose) kinase
LGGLDIHFVAIGAGLEHNNYISESTGTVLACVNYQKGYRPRKGVNIAPGLKDGYFFQMAFDENGAVALEWYQKKHVLEFSIVELLKIAEGIEPGSEGLVAKPNANRFKELKGFRNIKEFHLPPHFVRAILESTSLSLLKLTKDLDNSGSAKAIIPSGGGAQSCLWIQIKADILNKNFILPYCSELACQGAAIIGAIGTSNLDGVDEVIENWTQYSRLISPNPTNVEKYRNWVNKKTK